MFTGDSGAMITVTLTSDPVNWNKWLHFRSLTSSAVRCSPPFCVRHSLLLPSGLELCLSLFCPLPDAAFFPSGRNWETAPEANAFLRFFPSPPLLLRVQDAILLQFYNLLHCICNMGVFVMHCFGHLDINRHTSSYFYLAGAPSAPHYLPFQMSRRLVKLT